MALRNLGRESGRSVTTMVALFVGVFGIGLILALGQNIKDEINIALSQQLKYNSFVIAGVKDKAAVDQQVAVAQHLQSEPLVTNLTQVAPVAVNDVPIGQVLATASNSVSSSNTGKRGALFFLSSVQGFDVANGSFPDATLMRGAGATEQGRLLNASDANTMNVIMPYPSSLAPLNLKVGDTITLTSAIAAQQTGTGTGSTGGDGDRLDGRDGPAASGADHAARRWLLHWQPDDVRADPGGPVGGEQDRAGHAVLRLLAAS